MNAFDPPSPVTASPVYAQPSSSRSGVLALRMSRYVLPASVANDTATFPPSHCIRAMNAVSSNVIAEATLL